MNTLTSVSNRPSSAGAPAPMVVDSGELAVPDQAPDTDQAPVPIPQPPSPWISIVAAAIILTLFSVLFYGMFTNTGLPNKDWERTLLLYNSVQTIVVAAVSALLGFQVSAAQTSAAVARGANDTREAEKLRANIKSFQAEIVRQPSQSERSFAADGAGMRDRILARAMLLLH